MKALILVDIQNDFLPGGALAVPDGDAVIDVANEAIVTAHARGCPVIATQDSHPADHRSFASQHPGRSVGDLVDLEGLPQILWPDHCVIDTDGWAFAATLRTDLVDAVFPKGGDRDVDSYSGFFDNGRRRATGLADDLRARGVTAVVVCGLATDYCVKATALDAVAEGFDTELLLGACRGVELAAGDVENAIREMRDAGVRVVSAFDGVEVSA